MTTQKLYNEDFRKRIPYLKNRSVDIAYLDSPYGIGFYDVDSKTEYIGKDGITGDNDLHEMSSCLHDMRFKLKDDCHIYVFAGYQKIDEVIRKIKQLYFYDSLIVWNKKGAKFFGNRATYITKHEFIVFAKPSSVAQRRTVQRMDAFIETPFEHVANRIHAHQKPLKVIEYIFKNSFIRGGLVFDPFAGSARAGIIARNYDMNYIGCEIDKEIYDVAYKNLNGTKRFF